MTLLIIFCCLFLCFLVYKRDEVVKARVFSCKRWVYFSTYSQCVMIDKTNVKMFSPLAQVKKIVKISDLNYRIHKMRSLPACIIHS
jgi:hypothetical protein